MMKAPNIKAVFLMVCNIFVLMNLTSAIEVTAMGREKLSDTKVGPELIIECTIEWQPVETYVSHTWEHDGIILSENTQLSSGISSRYYLSTDGFTLSIRNFVQSDGGKYHCLINYMEAGGGNYNARAIANVIVSQYLPPVNFPECSLTPSSPITIGNAPLFGCVVDTSSTNVPIMIQLILIRTDGTSFLLGESSGFTRLLTAEDNGAEFRCTMTSPTFPTASRTCSVGPITVVRPGELIPVTLAPVPPKRTSAMDTTLLETLSSTQGTFNTTLVSSLESEGIQLWAIIGAAVGALLIIFLLLIGIVCFRRRRKSEQDQEEQNLRHQRPSTDSVDVGDAIEMNRDAPVDNVYGMTPVPVASYDNRYDVEEYSSDDDYPIKPPIRDSSMSDVNGAGSSNW